MFRMLVVDDEQIVLDSIKFIVEKNFTDVLVVGTARSGREAIEKAEELKPDIIFMDIQMPGINGIEAIKEIKARYINVLFVIITAYEQFEFAKEAINLGVEQYLLKPLNRHKVIETIREAVRNIEEERKKRKKELELKEKIETVLPVLENGFIYAILLFENGSKELESYKQIIGFKASGGYIMTVEFGEEESPGKLGNKIGLSVKSHSFYPYFREIVKSRCDCIVGPIMLNRIVVFIPTDLDGDEYFHRLDALNLAEYILEKLSQKVDADFYIGIGRRYDGLENLIRSYEESLKAIRYSQGKGIVHIMDVPVESVQRKQYPFAKEKQLLESTLTGETNVSLQALNYIFEWLVDEYQGDVQSIKNNLLELMVLIHRQAWNYGVKKDEEFERQDYLGEMMEIQELSVLRSWCKEKIEDITHSIQCIKEKKINSLILKARDYINKHYDEEITLEEVSREVNISPQYFSRLFKEEMGENFIEYLTTVRINNAKELLEKKNLSVKEICYHVGYGDPNYFSRIFKKVVGLTPTEYKEMFAGKNEEGIS